MDEFEGVDFQNAAEITCRFVDVGVIFSSEMRQVRRWYHPSQTENGGEQQNRQNGRKQGCRHGERSQCNERLEYCSSQDRHVIDLVWPYGLRCIGRVVHTCSEGRQ